MKRLLVLSAALTTAFSVTAHAQNYPTRPVTMVVAAAAGGPIDVFGRIMAERMSLVVGERIVIENVGGGGGTLGGQRVARAEPDGYTTLLGTIATHVNPMLYGDKRPYHPIRDFVPVVLMAEIPLILIARKNLPANTFEEFAAYAKANPGRLNYGSAGVGSAAHLGCVMLEQAMGARFQHIPYRGTGPAMQDLAAGRLDFICEIAVTAVQSLKNRTVQALANL
jgi:tripartite-type tricarboxylate transporter receptor subunit TctC